MMKKLKSFLFGFALFLTPIQSSAALPNTLTQITKPYLGMYECTQLLLDGENKLDEFKYIKIQLKHDGDLVFTFLDKKGMKGESSAQYEYDEDRQALAVYSSLGGKKLKREFPLKNGEIFVHIIYETKTIMMKFQQT